MIDYQYDPHIQRCVSFNDLRNMLSEDGPTRANLLCMLDCMEYGFAESDTRISPLRTAPGTAPATHDTVVSEVMNRIGPAISDQIGSAINDAFATMKTPDRSSGKGKSGGNGGEDHPPVPANYGKGKQSSEVFGAADKVDPLNGLPLSEDVTKVERAPPKNAM